MRCAVSIALPLAVLASPLAAQDHDAHDPHKGHDPATKPIDTKPKGECVGDWDSCTDAEGNKFIIVPETQRKPEATPPVLPPVPMPMEHKGMVHGPSAPAASPPERALEGPERAADAIWGADAMAPSREAVRRENGAMTTGMVMVERFEARLGEGQDAWLWDVEAWQGSDIDKLWLKSEGEGELGSPVEDAEVQALWSHAITPFFDLQAGARLDIEPETRSHLVLGVQGLAPYMWHVDGAVFLSDRGDLTARLKGEYDQKITQRLILQPRAELEFSAQDVPERALGSGLTKAELGLRLRYEIKREFAPYVGVEYEAKAGRTASLARAAGEDPDAMKLLVGIRAWF
ncbi:MAG: copper resistance protein B [Sphingomonadaceae bacterium]|nr:copper resistance protein B [Sphingomonadaceae bacterium]